MHSLINQQGPAQFYAKAFELRERASERERLSITADFYQSVTGQLDKALQTNQREMENYPRDDYSDMSLVLCQQGQYEKAVEAGLQTLRRDMQIVSSYENLAFANRALQRFDESRKILDSAPTGKEDHYVFHTAVYALAFLTSDAAAMAREDRWFAGKSQHENVGLALASETEAYVGRIRKARRLTDAAVESAIRADSEENGAVWQAAAAVREAAYGNPAEARRTAAKGLRLAPMSQGVESEVAIAFAMAGDTTRAEASARNLQRRFPLDTQTQSLWLPAIQAQLELNRKNPTSALKALEAARQIEFGESLFTVNDYLYHVYLRGEAYLASGQGGAAAAEFQKNSRSQRNRVELLDRSAGAFGRCSRQRIAGKNVAGRRC